MLNGTLYLHPAYGRTYQTVEQLKKDWEDGKDFKITSGPYCSIRDEKALKSEWDKVVVLYTGTYDVVLYDGFSAI